MPIWIDSLLTKGRKTAVLSASCHSTVYPGDTRGCYARVRNRRVLFGLLLQRQGRVDPFVTHWLAPQWTLRVASPASSAFLSATTFPTLRASSPIAAALIWAWGLVAGGGGGQRSLPWIPSIGSQAGSLTEFTNQGAGEPFT